MVVVVEREVEGHDDQFPQALADGNRLHHRMGAYGGFLSYAEDPYHSAGDFRCCPQHLGKEESGGGRGEAEGDGEMRMQRQPNKRVNLNGRRSKV